MAMFANSEEAFPINDGAVNASSLYVDAPQLCSLWLTWFMQTASSMLSQG
jgi:hypothetical protein